MIKINLKAIKDQTLNYKLCLIAVEWDWTELANVIEQTPEICLEAVN